MNLLAASNVLPARSAYGAVGDRPPTKQRLPTSCDRAEETNVPPHLAALRGYESSLVRHTSAILRSAECKGSGPLDPDETQGMHAAGLHVSPVLVRHGGRFGELGDGVATNTPQTEVCDFARQYTIKLRPRSPS